MNTFKACLLIFLASVICAMLYNYLSPRGIALVGEWDTSKGVVSAVSKRHPMVHKLEIDNVKTVKKIFDSGKTLFVDARPRDAFIDGHIRGAVSLPVEDFANRIENFYAKHPPSTDIVTYCTGRQCQDSSELAQLLIQVGYKHVRVFIDGYPVWEKTGYPVEKGSAAEGK